MIGTIAYVFIQAAALPASLPDDPGGTVAFVKTAYESKAWTLLVAAVLMILVRVATLLTPFRVKLEAVHPEAAKWLAIILSMASSLGTNLMTGSGWFIAVVNGLTAGLMAIGAWEAIGKHTPGLKKPDDTAG